MSPCFDFTAYIADIYELYGMSNIHVERYDSAIVAFSHALDITPDNRDYWFNRAYCLYQVGDSKAALQQLDYILKRWKTFDAATQLRADIVAGRKPKQQPMKSNTPQFYKLPSLKVESDDKANPMKNNVPFFPFELWGLRFELWTLNFMIWTTNFSNYAKIIAK